MTTPNYPPPVDRLLTLGDPEGGDPETWPDYLALGLGPEHVPDLIRLACDDQLRWDEAAEEPALWAQIHAWRALGQLRAAAAAAPLLALLWHIDDDGDDWAGEELPHVYRLIGPPAVPALASYLHDPARSTFARVAAGEGLRRIGAAHRRGASGRARGLRAGARGRARSAGAGG